MAEGDDYTPAPWARQHDFTAARATYDQHAGRSYAEATTAKVTASDLVPDLIETRARRPLLIRCDVSGSMIGWPSTFFSKFPYLDHEVKTEYLGPDAEISFGAISDTDDEYPLQFQPFTSGAGLKTSLTKLVTTNGGAGPGSLCEAYALSALYDCRNARFPNAVGKPILIMVGDEKPYDVVTKAEALKFAKVHMEEARLSADAIFRELMATYSVYFIQKPYYNETISGDRLGGRTQEVFDRWEKILGSDRIALLPDAHRVVDVVFGLLAKETDRIDYFREEIEGRQNASQVETVYKSLFTVHGNPTGGTKKPGTSRMHDPTGGKKSKGLLDKK